MEKIKAENQKKEQIGEVTGEEIARSMPALTPGFEKIKKAYEQMFGRQMTDDQISNLFKTAQLLEIKEDDGIWLFLLANENYMRLFLEMPWAITAACKAIIKEMQALYEAQIKKAVADMQCEVARIARQNSKISKSWVDKFIQVGFTAGMTLSLAVSYVTFKLLAYKTVENAGFSDFSNTLFRLLF